MLTQTSIDPKVDRQLSTSTLFPNLASLAFGALLLFAVGFLPMDAAHNAAHDTRHALAFPCH